MSARLQQQPSLGPLNTNHPSGVTDAQAAPAAHEGAGAAAPGSGKPKPRKQRAGAGAATAAPAALDPPPSPAAAHNKAVCLPPGASGAGATQGKAGAKRKRAAPIIDVAGSESDDDGVIIVDSD